ncbi:HesA/MoeB/ThiF family protein [Hippea sp. KM1]|uniref:HesA/MoeB/ThiF family protein n=1 Tax=Hippea sp. KM1 TaxID=944481 RepID=UPI00046D06E3|nr:HesA/MoeB/ThiF family protein [Hippea sp. KM1]
MDRTPLSILSRNLQFYGKSRMDKVSKATVLVAGIGGLGCIVSEILTRMGIKRLIILDNGIIDEPDLGRQSLYTIYDVGRRKVEAAKDRLKSLTGLTEIEPVFASVSQLEQKTIDGCDCVVDCLDNFQSRFELEDRLKEGQPLVHGGIQNDYGQLTTIIKGKTPGLKEIYANVKEDGLIAVSTPIVFTIASLMACEVINNITGSPQLVGSMLIVELSDFTFTQIELGV